MGGGRAGEAGNDDEMDAKWTLGGLNCNWVLAVGRLTVVLGQSEHNWPFLRPDGTVQTNLVFF
jgi:hypothetical protein